MQNETTHAENMYINPAILAATVHDQMNEETIQAWLVEQIAQITGLMPDDVNITLPFSFYSIDSVAAAGLSGEISNWLRICLAPTITWDYPTIHLLARHLVRTYSPKRLLPA